LSSDSCSSRPCCVQPWSKRHAGRHCLNLDMTRLRICVLQLQKQAKTRKDDINKCIMFHLVEFSILSHVIYRHLHHLNSHRKMFLIHVKAYHNCPKSSCGQPADAASSGGCVSALDSGCVSFSGCVSEAAGCVSVAAGCVADGVSVLRRLACTSCMSYSSLKKIKCEMLLYYCISAQYNEYNVILDDCRHDTRHWEGRCSVTSVHITHVIEKM